MKDKDKTEMRGYILGIQLSCRSKLCPISQFKFNGKFILFLSKFWTNNWNEILLYIYRFTHLQVQPSDTVEVE